MYLPLSTNPSRSLQALKIVLYVLSGLVLVPGLTAGISLISASGYIVANALLPLQLMGIGELSSLMDRMLSGLVINLGVVILILSVLFSVLLYAAGRMVGHIAHLEARLATLESKA